MGDTPVKCCRPTSGVIILPPERNMHSCLDHLPEDKGSTGLPIGSLGQCPICGDWWVVKAGDYGAYRDDSWNPVRWTDFAARRRIRDEHG